MTKSKTTWIKMVGDRGRSMELIEQDIPFPPTIQSVRADGLRETFHLRKPQAVFDPPMVTGRPYRKEPFRASETLVYTTLDETEFATWVRARPGALFVDDPGIPTLVYQVEELPPSNPAQCGTVLLGPSDVMEWVVNQWRCLDCNGPLVSDEPMAAKCGKERQ